MGRQVHRFIINQEFPEKLMQYVGQEIDATYKSGITLHGVLMKVEKHCIVVQSKNEMLNKLSLVKGIFALLCKDISEITLLTTANYK